MGSQPSGGRARKEGRGTRPRRPAPGEGGGGKEARLLTALGTSLQLRSIQAAPMSMRATRSHTVDNDHFVQPRPPQCRLDFTTAEEG